MKQSVMERNWEKQVMEILIDYDYRYSVASLSILMEKIRPVISQALTDQVEAIGKEVERMRLSKKDHVCSCGNIIRCQDRKHALDDLKLKLKDK